jgi:membrane associated rhomboid family serine protease
MLIPIGHERTTVRRLPWVTFTVMILCLVIFLVTLPGESKHQRVAIGYLEEAVEYLVEHPYLELQPRFRDLLALQVGEELLTSELELMRQTGPRPPADELARQEEQDHLDSLGFGFFEALDSSPARLLGLVPARLHPHALVTYQFLHAGWMHLIFNIIFLFVVGPFIEDVWGRPLYAGFYLAAGIVSAMMFAVRYPELEAPLIGASGAVAGVMGAFLVRFVKAKMRFILWVGVPLGPFQAPAWVIFPFWFLIQLFSAQIMDTALPESGGGGVAFWAHVWGFGFGAVVAAAMGHFHIEERFIHRSIESKITLIENTAVEEASQLAENGEDAAAIAALERELAARPDNIDAAMSMWNLCFERGQVDTAIPHMVRALGRAVRTGDRSFVIANWEEVLYSGSKLAVDLALGVRIADILVDDARHDAARDTLELLYRSVDQSTPAAILLRLARLGISLDAPGSGRIAAAALAHPELPPDAREELESAATGTEETSANRPPGNGQESAEGEPEVGGETTEHTVEVMSAVPRQFAGDSLELEVRGEPRSLALSAIQALGVCGISRSGQRPVVLVDLLLDSPWGDRPTLRVVRMTSDTFDPRRLIGGEEPLEAFQNLLKRLLDISGAVPLPDPDAAVGKPFRSFPSIDAYQREVLGVG